MKSKLLSFISIILLLSNVAKGQLQGTESSKVCSVYTGTFVVNGDKDTYYPVIFKYGNQNRINHLCIFRSYNEPGPDELSPTHKGGLTLEIDLNYGGWGGSTYDWRISDLRQTYHETFAKGAHSMFWMGFTVWLRGGGFVYHYESNSPSNLQVAYSNDVIYTTPNPDHPEWTVKAGNPITTIDRNDISNHLLSITFSKQNGNAIFNQGNVGIGTSAPVNKLEVNGSIRAKEVKVESGWADFVFDPSYNLQTLEEVASFIDENGHLPGIPNAQEVKQHGVNLGEMNTKLLQKIEELTLYLISQKKEIEALKHKNIKIKKHLKIDL